MAYAHSKENFLAVVSRAAALIAGGVPYRLTRNALVEEFGCSRMAAHRAYHRALAGDGDNWGGQRDGAGRPKNEPATTGD